MNSITKFAVKYPVSVLMLTLAVCRSHDLQQ